QRLIAGVAAQYESEVVYHKIREDLEEKGVIFLDTDTGLKEHPDLFQEYFASVIPVGDNKFAALNTAVWSGGSFIYVPKGATMEWIDGNIGSKVTMKYPSVYLMGEHARGETLSVAFAGKGQHQDAGAKMVHCAPNTSSQIISKSVARAGGRTSYRGLVQVQ